MSDNYLMDNRVKDTVAHKALNTLPCFPYHCIDTI